MREMTSIEWSIHWRSFNIEYFITKQMTEDEKRAVFVFSSFHPNGYIREQAIQSLVKYRNVIPFILLRCNDWVYQVRQSAFYSLSEVLSHCRNEEIIDALPVMTTLFRSKRCEYNNILLLILDFFQKEPNLIKQGLESKDVRVRSFCISILNSQSKIDYLYLRDYILQEKEPFLRKKVFQMLLITNLSDISLIDLSNIFLKDKYPTNRMLALQYLYDNKKDDIFDIAVKMLMDKNAQVRNQACKIVLEKKASVEIHRVYLNDLYVHTAISIYGLEKWEAVRTAKLSRSFYPTTKFLLFVLL